MRTVTTKVPAATVTKVVIRPPRMVHVPTGVNIEHTEKVATIYSTTEFAVQRFEVTPEAFPWAKPIALQYDYYVFDHVEYRYVPSCGTTTSGNVFMAYDYDPADPTPLSDEEMTNCETNATTPMFTAAKLSAHKPRLHVQSKYYCGGTTPIQLRQPAAFYLATAAATLPVLAGTLYVSYTVRFVSPQPPSRSSTSLLSQDPGAFTSSSVRPFLALASNKTQLAVSPNALGTASEGIVQGILSYTRSDQTTGQPLHLRLGRMVDKGLRMTYTARAILNSVGTSGVIAPAFQPVYVAGVSPPAFEDNYTSFLAQAAEGFRIWYTQIPEGTRSFLVATGRPRQWVDRWTNFSLEPILTTVEGILNLTGYIFTLDQVLEAVPSDSGLSQLLTFGQAADAQGNYTDYWLGNLFNYLSGIAPTGLSFVPVYANLTVAGANPVSAPTPFSISA